MLHWLPAPLRGLFAALAVGVNTVLVFVLFTPFALIKLLVPLPWARKAADYCLVSLAHAWVAVNNGWMAAVQKLDWRVTINDTLALRGWYLVSCNHQSWADILVLQRVFHNRIPFLKFFLKRELIYVPVIGLAWWALDFPFMRRSGKAADLAVARAACEKFRHIPTSVINFLEGTRFTAAKHRHQRSPYRHLLKPKSGGAAIAMATLGDKFGDLLDVTIVYPDGIPTFWQLMCGRLGRVWVEVNQHPIPAHFLGEAQGSDPASRAQIQSWLNDIWQAKDARIDALIHGDRTTAEQRH